jgi:sec-independent protein translocase protein TatC
MAHEPEEGLFPDAEEGGPIKSFLEHLEDLRWTLIKSAAVVAIAVVVCLLAGNHVVNVLKWPLRRAKISYPGTNKVVTLSFGTNRFGVYPLTPAQDELFDLGTNRFVALQVAPITIPNGTGTVQVLAIKVDSNQNAAETAQHLDIDLINLGPADAFMTAFHVAVYAGIAIASPFIFYFISQFVFPALKMNEKKYIYRGLGFGFGLFLTGVTFCYFALMPVALAASQAYSNWMGFRVTMWKAEEYIGFICKFMLGMGLGFEMPVVILVLVKLGILNYQMLKKARPYMIVINFVLGAVLTTPEVVTQVLMALPLQILFEISVWIAWYWEKQDKKREDAASGIIDAH